MDLAVRTQPVKLRLSPNLFILKGSLLVNLLKMPTGSACIVHLPSETCRYSYVSIHHFKRRVSLDFLLTRRIHQVCNRHTLMIG